MIAACRNARSFQNVARYLEQPKAGREDLPRIMWTDARNLIHTDNLDQAAREMALMARSNTRVEQPALHMSISWAPEDNPSPEQMREVAYRVQDAIGLENHQCVLVAHGDEAYAHVHTITNRIHPESSQSRPRTLFYRTIETTLRHTEREMGFRETPGHLFQLPGQQPPDRTESLSKTAHKATTRRREIPFQVIVRDRAEHHFTQARSWQDLHHRLDLEDLRLKPRGRGLVVTDGHEFAKCSSVAPDGSLRKMEARFKTPVTPPEIESREKELGTLKHQLQLLPDPPTTRQKSKLAQSFIRLDQVCPNLPAQFGTQAYRRLKSWAEHERALHDLGL